MLTTAARSAGVRFVATLGAAAAVVALITLALLAPAPYAVEVGEPGDAYALANFHRPEATYRWSAPGAALLIPAAHDGPLALTLRLSALPAGATMRVERDNTTLAALGAAPGWRVYRLLLPPDAAPEPAQAGLEPLGLDVPAGYGPGDARPLGVAVDALEVGPAAGASPLLPALGRATAIAWALGLAWAALAALFGWRHPAATAAPLLLSGAGLAAWAWRAPLGFAWGAPAPPWWLLALATAALGAWLGARGLWRPGAWRLAPAGRWAGVILPAGLAIAPALLLLAGLPPPWSGAAALAVVLLPGALAARALFPEERAPATVWFIGASGALAVAALLLLALHALPGPLPPWLLVGACSALSAALIGARAAGAGRAEAAGAPAPPAERADRAVVLALVVGAALRLWQLGGAEFQGDEARAMLLALGAARGDDGLLLTHTKGPAEALLPLAVIAASGGAAEWAARLPFALASLGVLLGALALMRAFGARGAAPLLSVALLAVDGFAVAFGRIVQYQSLVMLMMTAAFWACWRFYAGAERPWRHLGAAAALLAVGLLAHYDAAYVAPALGWLVVAGGLRRGWRGAAWARALAAPTLIGAALLASFYLPYLTSASFAQTAEYLAGRAGQGDAGGPPFNNLPLYYSILAFYNAPPLAPLLVALVVGALAALLAAYVKPRLAGALLAGGLALATLAQWLAPGLLALPGGGSWALLAFGAPLAGLCCLLGAPGPVRATAIWFAAAFWAQAFVIAEPRTHFYAAHVPAALLVGLAVAALAGEGRRPAAEGPRAVGRAARLAATLVLVGGGLYGGLVYLRQLPEYQRWFPAARPAWLAGPYGETLPEAGYFGFPHRDGWKAAAELLRAGELRGSYDTNQNRWLAGWYLGGLSAQCKGAPELYLIAEGEPTVYFPPGYHMVAEVTVGPGRAMAIYGREPPAGGPRSHALAELAASFDRRRAAPFDAGALLNDEPARCP